MAAGETVLAVCAAQVLNSCAVLLTVTPQMPAVECNGWVLFSKVAAHGTARSVSCPVLLRVGGFQLLLVTSPSPVLLLAALHADLGQREGHKQAHVPGDQVPVPRGAAEEESRDT